MAAYCKILAHSAYDMFYKYKYLIVNLVFPTSFFEWEFHSDCALSDRCLLVPPHMPINELENDYESVFKYLHHSLLSIKSFTNLNKLFYTTKGNHITRGKEFSPLQNSKFPNNIET